MLACCRWHSANAPDARGPTNCRGREGDHPFSCLHRSATGLCEACTHPQTSKPAGLVLCVAQRNPKLQTDIGLIPQNSTLYGKFSVAPGQRRYFSLSYCLSEPAIIPPLKVLSRGGKAGPLRSNMTARIATKGKPRRSNGALGRTKRVFRGERLTAHLIASGLFDFVHVATCPNSVLRLPQMKKPGAPCGASGAMAGLRTG